MAETKKGSFDKTYHHIEAPTHQDVERGKLYKRRILSFDKFRKKEVEYLKDNLWSYKRKLDGENIRIKWDGEQALWNGKTNNFVCSKEFEDYMNETFAEELFEEKFGRDKEVYLYGEKMGFKTQTNELNLETVIFVLFDVEIYDTFLSESSIKDIGKFFNIKTCYDFMNEEDDEEHTMSLSTAIDEVMNGFYKDWEGLVLSPLVNIKDNNGKRIIVKVKNKDYLK